MSKLKIGFIGAGNMAKSIIGGLLAEDYPAPLITASAARQETLDNVKKQFGINVSLSNRDIAKDADVIILAVKPQMLKPVALEIASSVQHKPLIISIAAGVTTENIGTWLGGEQAIIRAMPNTPSMVKEGAIGAFANAQVSLEQRTITNEILGAVGLITWLEQEHLLNSVTAVSGSGPAYFFLVMESMIEAGMELGLSKDCATELTLQTALGAALLAKNGKVDVADLRRHVTSPNGTTEQAIKSFENDAIRAMFSRAMRACADRSAELSQPGQ